MHVRKSRVIFQIIIHPHSFIKKFKQVMSYSHFERKYIEGQKGLKNIIE